MIEADLHAPFSSAVRLILTGSMYKALDNAQRSVFLNMRSEKSRVEKAEWRQADFEARPAELKKKEAAALDQWKQEKPDWFIHFKKLGTKLGRSVSGEEETHYYLPDIFEFICAYIKAGNTVPPIDTSYVGELLNLVEEPRANILLRIVQCLKSLQSKNTGNTYQLERELEILRKEYGNLLAEAEIRRFESKGGELGMTATEYRAALDLAKLSPAEMDNLLKNSKVQVAKVVRLTPKRKLQFLIMLVEVSNRNWDRLAIPDGYLNSFLTDLHESYDNKLFPKPQSKGMWENLSKVGLVRPEKVEQYSNQSKSLKS